jgi:hypothetical protein
LARVLIHIPEPKKHLVLFYGVYANRIRATYRSADNPEPETTADAKEATPKRALSKRWAELIYRIYQVDPLDCPRCRARMKILALITDPKVIRQILDHLDQRPRPRAPPGSNGLAFDPEGRLVLCEHGNRRIARLERDGTKTTLADRYPPWRTPRGARETSTSPRRPLSIGCV